ncbi:hypothetical protein [Amaricoccus solimangrovi]|uniref:Uncharacterized protein n=1 Tax=Amaricoccus solimangrovi TaxID=2589815 RepID=A0A501WDS5_9RHOB|nr:hypothetical protein [Amaricoccus solimangrovi]TPE47548.1 hypothetical protein FJM51_19635 [Amaricoccus solimangrovi]
MLIEITGTESLCKRARRLIREGADPNEHVEWVRNGIPVFKRTCSLSEWAGHRIMENDHTSARFVRYTPNTLPAANT